MKPEIGKPYRIKDYEGNILPGKWTPIKRISEGWYLTVTPQGGHCHVKESEFVQQVRLRP